MNHWILENVSMIDFTDKIVKHNIAIGKLEKPSLIFRKIYENITLPSTNKYVLAMQDLNSQMYDLMHAHIHILPASHIPQYHRLWIV
jgi:hypothetical protein